MAGCGSDAVHDPNYGQPRPTRPTITGNDNGPGSAYGYGLRRRQQQRRRRHDGRRQQRLRTRPTRWSPAPTSQQRCTESRSPSPTPTLSGSSSSGITGVELRGDYRAGAWDAGDTMTLDKTANVWTVSVPVPAGISLYNTSSTSPARATATSQGMGTGSMLDLDHLAADGDPQRQHPTTTPTRSPATITPAPPAPAARSIRRADKSGLRLARRGHVLRLRRPLPQRRTPANDNTPSLPALPPGDDQGKAQFQGGDWQGVIDKINDGYFTDLGVNTLWITVPMKNDDQLAGLGTSDSHLYSAYHGYWSSFQPSDSSGNPTIEDHFGIDHRPEDPGDDGPRRRTCKIVFDYELVSITTTAARVQRSTRATAGGGPTTTARGATASAAQGCDWNNNFPSGTTIGGVELLRRGAVHPLLVRQLPAALELHQRRRPRVQRGAGGGSGDVDRRRRLPH